MSYFVVGVWIVYISVAVFGVFRSYNLMIKLVLLVG